MNGLAILLVCLISLGSDVLAKDYSGYKVIRLQVKTDEDQKDLETFGESEELDFWQGPSINVKTDILVGPDQLQKVTDYLDSRSLKWDIEIEDVEEKMEEEERSSNAVKMTKKFRAKGGDSAVGYYADHKEINEWLTKLAQAEKLCSTEVMGKSYEGRDQLLLKISTDASANKPIVFLDAGIHAREWLGPATLTYMIDKLLKSYKSGESQATALLNKYDFYFLPVVNPDGYQYTFKSRQTRLWRKTRKPYGKCFGADPNRNFDAHFGQSGISHNPCSDIYCGPKPFSEPETLNFANYMKGIKDRVKLYTALHAYSQLWFVPYAYARTYPEDIAELTRVARIGKLALLKVNGVNFRLGSPPQLLYAASGGSYDWVKQIGVKYSYTFELRPGQSRNGKGFMAPVSYIKPSGEEVYAGIMASAQAMKV